MKRFVLSPANRLALSTIPGMRRRFAVMRAFRREMDSPGAFRNTNLGAVDTVRLIYMVGLVRQPAFFVLGTAVAIISYIYIAALMLASAFEFILG